MANYKILVYINLSIDYLIQVWEKRHPGGFASFVEVFDIQYGLHILNVYFQNVLKCS